MLSPGNPRSLPLAEIVYRMGLIQNHLHDHEDEETPDGALLREVVDLLMYVVRDHILCRMDH